MTDPAQLPERFGDADVIGQGGQGQTFRAHDRELGKTVAVKVLSLSAHEGWKGFELFERECAALRTIDHPGVPTYYDHFGDEAKGRWYLVMELIEGRPLSLDLAEQRRRSESELLSVLEGLLEIVGYLHGLLPPVVHRDIKPANVIQRADGHVALVDFGGVTHALRSKGGSTMIGTFGYMAPEQLYGQAGPATDLYALGATVAALAGGVEAEDLPRRGMDIDVAALVGAGPLRRALSVMCRSDLASRAQSVADVRAAIAADPASRVLAPAAGGALALSPAERTLAQRADERTPRRRGLLGHATPRQRRIHLVSTAALLGVFTAIGPWPIAVLWAFLYTFLYGVGVGIVRGYRGEAD
ncbi:MAG: serine/threonine-protein kinase [Myxococcota bacterium]